MNFLDKIKFRIWGFFRFFKKTIEIDTSGLSEKEIKERMEYLRKYNIKITNRRSQSKPKNNERNNSNSPKYNRTRVSQS